MLVKVWVFDSVPLESSSSWKVLGERPPPAVNEKSWASSGCASLTAMILPLRVFVNVHVTVSPALTEMFGSALPSSQVAPACVQPATACSETEYPDPGATSLKVRLLESVASESSSSWKLDGLRPPPVVNAKSCGSFGWASLTITILPRWELVNVHVTT